MRLPRRTELPQLRAQKKTRPGGNRGSCAPTQMASDDDELQGVEVEVAPLADGVAATKDWTGKYTTKVKDQAQCGSCWAFSAVEQIESDAMRELGKDYILSEQQVVSCDKQDGG